MFSMIAKLVSGKRDNYLLGLYLLLLFLIKSKKFCIIMNLKGD